MRGAIRWKRGQSIESILKVEGQAVLREVVADITAVGTEIGVGVLEGLQTIGARWIADKLTGGPKR
jgi:hypothetical protein